MNIHSESLQAILTMTYEFVPGTPTAFDKVIPLWLDIASCDVLEHEIKLKENEGLEFEYDSSVWKSNASYRIISNTGHLHDGGIHLKN